MTNRWYRLQDADRDAAELLDSANHWSSNWGGAGDPRHGVSVCRSESDLADYFASMAADCGFDADFLSTLALVEVAGELSDDTDEDEAKGAYLIIPTQIISVGPVPADMVATIICCN